MSYKNILKRRKSVTQVVLICTPTSNMRLLPSLHQDYVLKCFDLCQSNGIKTWISVVLICISFITSETECLSICLRASCISLSVYYMFIFYPLSFFGSWSFVYWFQGPLHIIGKLVSVNWLSNIFSLFVYS